MSTQHRCLTQDQAGPGDVNSRVCRSYVEGELSRAKAQQAPYRHEKCVAVTRSSILDFADELLCGYVCVRNHFRMERKSCVDASVIGQGSKFFNLHEGSRLTTNFASACSRARSGLSRRIHDCPLNRPQPPLVAATADFSSTFDVAVRDHISWRREHSPELPH
ncbi:MAG TPA: hypothetical protein VHV99_09460 [Paraburkholderia sp.]|jgi:hypothetical protein|nr:hypothetical protein [Paraburkholderia sp.]